MDCKFILKKISDNFSVILDEMRCHGMKKRNFAKYNIYLY